MVEPTQKCFTRIVIHQYVLSGCPRIFKHASVNFGRKYICQYIANLVNQPIAYLSWSHECGISIAVNQ